MELPTPFLRGLAGVQVRHSDSKDGIEVMLPAFLVPRRRRCEVLVSLEVNGTFLVQVVHNEPFVQAKPGFNAWQVKCARQPEGLPGSVQATLLDRPWSRVLGASEPVRMLIELLRRSGAMGCEAVHVRATPEGFMLRIYPQRERAMGLGHRLTGREQSELRDALCKAYMHGGRGRQSQSPSLWKIPASEHVRLENCRCVFPTLKRPDEHITDVRSYHGNVPVRLVDNIIQSLQTDFGTYAHIPITSGYRSLDGICIGSIKTVELSNQGDSTMKKIDTTTHASLPLSVAGQRIVRAQFEDGRGQKDYAYYTDDETIAKDDFVVVVSPYGEVYDQESQGYVKVVKVVSVEETVEAVTKASKWIVQKVDLTTYRERMAKIERLKLLDAKIEQAKKEAMRRLELKQLMDMSPELKGLVEERLGLSAPATEAEG